MEKAPDPVGGAFKDNFGPVHVRNGLKHTRGVVLRVGPKRNFGAVEVLDRLRSAGRFSARGSYAIAAVQIRKV